MLFMVVKFRKKCSLKMYLSLILLKDAVKGDYQTKHFHVPIFMFLIKMNNMWILSLLTNTFCW